MTDRLTASIDVAPRPVRVAAHSLLNAASIVSAGLRRRREGFGMGSGGLDNIRQVLASLAGGLSAVAAVQPSPAVVELGPGRTPHVAAAFALCGAVSVSSFDVESMLDDGAQATAQYAALAADLAEGECAPFRIAMRCDPGTPLARVRSAEPLPIQFRGYDGQHLLVPDGSIDIVTSNSVLEHVRRGLLNALLGEVFRVLRPGGVMVHWIDLRDHLRITGNVAVSGDWLDALRYTEREYEAMFSHRPVYINRLRSSQWRLLLEGAGFEIVRWNPIRVQLPAGFARSRLQPPWRDYSEKDLGVAVLECTLRKPERVSPA